MNPPSPGFTSILAETIERVNASWVVLDLCLVAFLSYYLWTTRNDGGSGRWSFLGMLFKWNNPQVPLHVQAAVAILVFHTGDVGVKALVWWVRHQVNQGDGVPPAVLFPISVGLALFAVVAGVGVLCMLRIFSAPWLGRWVWLASGLLAILAAFLTRMLPI
jgi:hypothetical protein